MQRDPRALLWDVREAASRCGRLLISRYLA